MEPIFNLDNIKKLVEDNKPRAILLVDTNIVMHNPIMTKWETDLNEPIYIFPGIIISELEFLKTKKNAPETTAKCKTAINEFASFAATGNIAEGIHLNSGGWIISVATPVSSVIKPALAEIETIVKGFGESDAQMILIHMEVSKLFEGVPVIFLSNDINLSNSANINGFLTHPAWEFPLQIDSWLANKRPAKPIDFDQVLRDITQEAEKNTWTVEVTMLSKRYDSEHVEIDGMLAKAAKEMTPEMLESEADKTQEGTPGGSETYRQISDLRSYRTYEDTDEKEWQYPSWYQYKENKRDIESGIRKGFIVMEGTGRIIRPEKHDMGFTWKTYYKPVISPVMASGDITELEDLIGRRLATDGHSCYTIINLQGNKQLISDMLIPLIENEIRSCFKSVLLIPGCKTILRWYSAESPLSIVERGTGLADKYWTHESLKPDILIKHLANYMNNSTEDDCRRLLYSILFTWDVGQKIRFQIEKSIEWQDGRVECLINE
jgi:hypothetical protein